MASNKDIDDLLDKWYEAKQTIAELEKKQDKYKKLAEKLMSSSGSNSLSSSSYKLSRKNMIRLSLSKKDVPDDIWNRYAKQISYSAYYIKKQK